MRAGTFLLVILSAALALVGFSLPGSAPGTLLETGTTHHVEVTTSDQGLDLIAGLVTESTSGPLGFSADKDPAQGGWVLIVPEDASVPSEPTPVVEEERPFEDPNGATWLSREVTVGDTVGWVVPIGEPRQDPTLEASYNFAVIIDQSKLDDGQTLSVSVHESLDLQAPR